MDDGIRVLHVDDEPGVVDLTAEFLRREDDRIEVRSATSAADGLDRIDETVDCVVSDYGMPGMDGLAFLGAVRESYPDLPFILFTSEGSESIASEAISAGITDYLQKGTGTDQYALLANRIRNAVSRHRADRRAEDLERVRRLVREVNQALVRADSRAAIERRVCEIVSDTDPYRFAWIGVIEEGTNEVVPRATAGLPIDLDSLRVTVDDSEYGQGPIGRAFRSGDLQVVQDTDDLELAEWRAFADEHDIASLAVVPLVHDDDCYGVLDVYTDRRRAFHEGEQELLRELGDDIAHAIHARESRSDLQRYRHMVDAMREAACVYDESGRFEVVNEYLAEFYGTTTDALVGESSNLLPRIREAAEGDPYAELVAGEREELRGELEGEFPGRGRAVLTYRLTRMVVDGEFEGVVGTAREITARKDRERKIETLHSTAQSLMRAETKEAVAEIAVGALRDILDMPINSVHLHDADRDALVPVAWTEESEAMFDEIPVFPLGESLAGQVFATGERQTHADVSTAAGRLNPDTEMRSEVLLPLADHGVIVIGSTDVDAFDEVDVSLARTLAAHLETTFDRIDSETELRESTQRYRTLVENFPDGGVFLYDHDLNCLIAGGEGLSDVDLSPESVQTTAIRERYPEAIAEQLEANLRAAFEGERRSFEQSYAGNYYRVDTLPVHGPDGEVEQVMAVSRNITERREYERVLTSLHEVAGRLDDCDTVEAVCRVTIEAAQDLLAYDLSLVAIEEDGRLEVRATSDDLDPGTYGSMPVEEGIAGKTYRTGETILIEDVEGNDLAREDTPYRSGISLPIGGHGNFQAVAEDPGAFGEHDLELASLLLTHTAGSLDRIRRERELQAQNERLEEFTRVVSHDLRNPLNVARGRLELARERVDDENLVAVADAHERIETLIEDLLSLARLGEGTVDVEAIDLPTVVERCWSTVETGEATLVVETDLTVRANESQLRQLFENLIRNVVEHGGESVTLTVGSLPDGFYVEDDGPGIPPEDRDAVFDAGYSTAEEGTGFGLSIVGRIAEVHGWSVAVTGSEAGGARFEITGVDIVP